MLRQLVAVAYALALAGVSTHFETEVTYTVTGRVTTAGGVAIGKAFVEAVPIMSGKSGGRLGQLAWIQTDDQGRFHMSLLPGRYQMRAKAENDGYPDPNFQLSVDPAATFPEISVALADISGVNVTLGGKGGILVGELRDEVTKKPIVGKITITDARKPQAFVELFSDQDGHFQFTVPNKPILISATAPGYKTTNFQGRSEAIVSDGERRAIVLELKGQ
jgi:hypothetical protein